MFKTRIFVLDDDRFYGALIQRALESELLEVRYFQSERECIVALGNPPDILILDHYLEQSTGLEVLEFLKDQTGQCPIVIYLSAQEHVHVALKAINLGAMDYLEKNEIVLEGLKHRILEIAHKTKNFHQPMDRRKFIMRQLKSDS